MDFENDNKKEEMSVEQTTGNREGYQASQSAAGGFQREFRPGRSPRPRIHTGQQRPFAERPAYNKPQNDDEGGFRPEGFGAGLQSAAPQQRTYRPRNTYGQQGGGYQPRQQGGYQPRGGYGQQRPSYNANSNYAKPYTKKPYGAGSDDDQKHSGYQPRGGYQPRQQGGYQPRGGYGQQQGGYQPRGGYGQQRRPYGQPNAYSPVGSYNKKPYGPKRQRTADYDPNAKYSMKKRIEYKEVNYDPNEPIRLNKYLANAGVCSRREADEFIQAGVVTVNGEVVTELGTKVLRTDNVMFHDQPVKIEKKVYVLLNKPKDYVTTSDDPQQRKTVMDLVKNACPERIYPVGRLDRNTTGVLLLTNDGDLASKLTHPKFLKKKIYHVFLDKNVTAHDLQQIAEGIQLEDGVIKADDIQYASPTDKKQVGIEIHSGKNRIVRRIFESLGYRVQKLDRVQFAGLTKKNLKRGDWRYLTEEEVDRLRMGAYE